MSAHRLASRYAKSLLQLALEKNELDKVFADLKSVDEAFESSRDLKVVFKSPIISGDKKQAIADKLFKGKITDLTYEFISLLIRKGREGQLHEIANSFVEQYDTLKGITKVTVTTAVKLDSGVVDSLINGLKKKENLQQVELTELIDESLLGGFVLRYGDRMIDTSVKRRLHEFRAVVDDDSYIKKY